MNLENFISLDDFIKEHKEYSKSHLQTVKCKDEKINRGDRFVFINGNWLIHKDYPNIYTKEIDELEKLYFNVIPNFESELAMAKYFAPKVGVKVMNLYTCFRMFKFGGKYAYKYRKVRLALIKEFKEYLNDPKRNS